MGVLNEKRCKYMKTYLYFFDIFKKIEIKYIITKELKESKN
jgi:hypothetical protein